MVKFEPTDKDEVQTQIALNTSFKLGLLLIVVIANKYYILKSAF